MLDRNTPPPFQKSNSLTLIQPKKIGLPNGLTITVVPGGEQEVAKIELIFKAAKWHETHPGISYFTAQLLQKGTLTKNSFQISSEFDQHGVHLEVAPGYDFTSIILYGLTKNIDRFFELAHEIITTPIFPEVELQQAKDIYIQGLKINLEKTSYLASQLLRQTLFGKEHPYGCDADVVDVERIQRQSLVSFHQTHFNDFEIICSGKITEPLTKSLAEAFSKISVTKNNNRIIEKKQFTKPPSVLEKENTVQSSIRFGKKIISRIHPHYPALLFLNHILGGYFGSRLMKNIREEKGLTYGIYSSIAALKNDSYLSIGADVNKENRELTIQEIKNELKNLQTHRIGNDELVTAKNHFIGSLQAEITTSFAHADKIKNIILFALPNDYYQVLLNKIDLLNENNLIETAQQYFDTESFSVVAAG